jgi:hypothetical protein
LSADLGGPIFNVLLNGATSRQGVTRGDLRERVFDVTTAYAGKGVVRYRW